MLDLYLETQNGKSQLFGVFDFRVIMGIMRFEKPVPVPKMDKIEDESKKRKWEEGEDGDIEMDDIDAFDGGHASHGKYDEKVFMLGPKDKPTARRPTWRYRWRGRKTGETYSSFISDEGFSTMTFSKNGIELADTFKSGMLGDCQFKGLKVSPYASKLPDDPDT
jgi:hypothetical protein